MLKRKRKWIKSRERRERRESRERREKRESKREEGGNLSGHKV